MLGLPCCAQAFSREGSGVTLCCRAWASHFGGSSCSLVESGLWGLRSCGAQMWWPGVQVFLDRIGALGSCIGRWVASLSHRKPSTPRYDNSLLNFPNFLQSILVILYFLGRPARVFFICFSLCVILLNTVFSHC